MNNNRAKNNKNYGAWKNRLSLIKFMVKLGLIAVLDSTVDRLKTNKFVKKYDRGRLIAILLIAIILGSSGYRLEIEDHTYIALLAGQSGMPAKSTLSKTWGRLVDPLYYAYRYYTRQLMSRVKPIYDLVREVLIVDIKAIETKNRHAKLGYIHGRLKKGLKLHMSTLDTVPWIFFLTPANEHDSNYIDRFAREAKRRTNGPVYIVADRAFSSLEEIVELAKMQVYLVTPYKKNMKGFKFLKAFKAKDLIGSIRYKVYNGLTVYLIEAYDASTHKTWLILTPIDDPELAIRLYRARWSIEVLFKHLSTLGFKLLGHSYEAITASVLLFLLAYVLLRLYAIMLNRRFSVSNFTKAFYRWFSEVFKRTVNKHMFCIEAVKPPPRQQVREILDWLKGTRGKPNKQTEKA